MFDFTKHNCFQLNFVCNVNLQRFLITKMLLSNLKIDLKLCVIVALRQRSSPALVNSRQQPGLRYCFDKLCVLAPIRTRDWIAHKTGSSDPGTESNSSGTADTLYSRKKPRHIS